MLFLPLLCVDDAGKWNFLTCQVSQMEEGLEEKRLHVKELQKQSKVPSLLTCLLYFIACPYAEV